MSYFENKIFDTESIETTIPQNAEKNDQFTYVESLIRQDFDSRDQYFRGLEQNHEFLLKTFERSNVFFKEGLVDITEASIFTRGLIEKRTLYTITAGEIYTLKQEGIEISQLFLISQTGQMPKKDTMKVWDSFKVNFWANKSLNRHIGAGDLIDIQHFDRVRINGIEGTRRLGPRPGYYTSTGKYLPVFDNYEIEIIWDEIYSEEEAYMIEEAYNTRYHEIRDPEVLYDAREQIVKAGDQSSVVLEGLSKNDLETVATYFWSNDSPIDNYLREEVYEETPSDIKVDVNTGTIATTNGKTLNETVNKFIPKESLGTGYKRYEKEVIAVADTYPNIPTEKLIQLINKENGRWDPLASAPGSSAYGLGQMIDGTWRVYGEGLDRNNPRDQLEATCRYLDAIMKRKGCSVDMAMAYYNTWEWILSISDEKAEKYARNNPAIAKYITGPVTAQSYFDAAVQYYNS